MMLGKRKRVSAKTVLRRQWREVKDDFAGVVRV